jgi:selenocysteine lyase/cysteine desulfurase
VTVHDIGREQCGIVTFSVAGTPAREVAGALRARQVNVSVSPPSYSRVDFDRRGLGEIVRASAHYYNTDSELDALVDVVADVAAAQSTLS